MNKGMRKEGTRGEREMKGESGTAGGGGGGGGDGQSEMRGRLRWVVVPRPVRQHLAALGRAKL